MAECDRRWRPGCSRNYVDAHDEVWEAVQHEPARFSHEMFARSRRSRADCWKWASIDCNCWVCDGPGPVVGELCYQQDATAGDTRWPPACASWMAWYRAARPAHVIAP